MSGERDGISEPAYAGTIVQEFFEEVTEYAIFLIDTDGYVASWNEGAERIKGFTAEEIVGQHISVFYPDDPDDSDNADPETVLARAEREGSYEEVGVRVRKDGSRIWAQVTVRALYDDDGRLDGYAKIVRDITETREHRAELKRSRDRLERTEQLADVGGWELHFDPRELKLTDGTRHILDVPSRVELTQSEAAAFFHEDDRERIGDAIARVRDGGELFDLELRIVTARGRKRWVQIRGEATDDGEAVRGALRDVSERREREERLMVLNRVLRHNLRNNLNVVTGYATELGDELDALELPSMDDGELARLLDGLTDATADVDADVTLVEQILSAVEEFDTQSAVRMTDRIVENAEDLMSTGEKARTFEQAVEKDTERSVFAVRAVLTDLQTTFERRYPAAEIRTGGDELVFSNEHSLRLALGELVHNAIVHNGGDAPTVELTTRRVSDERVGIAVRDDGPGIPENEEKILRAGRETALRHGSGMGLWTVHWVVTQLGGDVAITRRDTEGSTVEVNLPAPREDDARTRRAG